MASDDNSSHGLCQGELKSVTPKWHNRIKQKNGLQIDRIMLNTLTQLRFGKPNGFGDMQKTTV